MMPTEFDPLDGLSPDDLEYLNKQRDAFARQKAAHDRDSGDDARAAAAEAHRREVMEKHGVTPSGEVLPTPGPSPSQTPGLFSVLKAEPEAEEIGGSIPSTREKYAPDWKHLKAQIANHDGIWIVSHYEFPAHTAFILGFFHKEGWDHPPDAKKRSFEVIVKNGRVFRSDPE